MTNRTPLVREFGIYRAFIMHIRVLDEDYKPLLLSLHVPVFMPIKESVRMEPGKGARLAFDIDLGWFYYLRPGIYHVMIMYDNRLLGLSKNGADPFVEWASEPVTIRYSGRSN